ncbi:hypothetical protein FJQ98_18820 [Lysinibacillus agricola]|uniref:Uncharacterized protein n=1 Tax=Lysinibacillus agricola TaxID=2590012 RepID=A0ABX7ASP1_9BACI|nr:MULTISPECIES: hypothetical protein [Lysinibacillus]QQP11254.1 hypothetical protein FJQ98_18820 [Lysinibacillus agricola]
MPERYILSEVVDLRSDWATPWGLASQMTLERSGCFLCESEAAATMFYLCESEATATMFYLCESEATATMFYLCESEAAATKRSVETEINPSFLPRSYTRLR